MTIALPGNRLLPRAFIASLVLHLLLVALIPPLVASSPGVETVTFVRIIQLAVVHPSPHPPAAVAAAAPVRSALAHPAPVRPLAKRALHHTSIKAASPVPQAPVVAAAARPGTGAVTVQSTAQPALATAPPQQPSDESPPSHQQIGGMMPLGADEPVPVLEPAVHQALVALGVHVTLTIDVDENGRTKAVAFAPPLDPAMEDKIRQLLASAAWDPAVCGAGTACEGSAIIRL